MKQMNSSASRAATWPRATLAAAMLGAAGALSGAFAADLTTLPESYDASTGFDVQNTTVYWGNWGTFVDCGAEPAVANSCWSSGQSIHSGTNYYTGRQSFVQPSAATIPGDDSELFVLGPTFLQMRYNLTCNRRFVALPGSEIRFSNIGKSDWTADGSKFAFSLLEVRSTVASPLTLAASCNSSTADRLFRVEAAKLIGPPSAAIYSPYSTAAIGNKATASAAWRFTGDASEFFGRWTVDGASVEPGALSLAIDTADFAGTVILTNDARLAKFNSASPRVAAVAVSPDSAIAQDGTAFTFGDMAFAAGGRVLYTAATPGLVTVTNSFVHDGPVSLDFNGLVPFSWTVAKSISGTGTSTNELFRFASGIEVSAADFKLENVGRSLGAHLPVPFLFERANQDGTTSILMTHRPVVVALRGMDMNDTESEAAAWSDNRSSHPDADYYLCWISADQSRTGQAMETPIYVQSAHDTTFGGGSLVVAGGILYIYAPEARFDSLVLYNGQIVASNPGGVSLSGGLHVTATASQNGRIRATSGPLAVHSGLTGTDDALARFPAGSISLDGDNSEYAGGFLFTSAGSSVLTVADGLSLGGGTAQFAYNAIDLNAVSGVLTITNDATFVDANRGVLVRQPTELRVAAGRTASFAAPFTFASPVTKTGGGVLSFGAKPRFIDGDAATQPVSGTNILSVAGGGVKVETAESLDGLDITFAADTELHLPGATDDAALEEFGAVMTNALSSVAFSGGKTHIILDDAAPDATKVVCGVFTFATKVEAETAAAALKPRKLSNGLPGSLGVVATAAGWTVTATWEQGATVLTVR